MSPLKFRKVKAPQSARPERRALAAKFVTSEVFERMGPLPGPGQLWQSRDSAVWRGVLRKYQDAVAAVAKSGGKGKERLIELDRYMRELRRGVQKSAYGMPGPHVCTPY